MSTQISLFSSGDSGRQDTAAFEVLFRERYSSLCRFVYGYVHSREVAQDIVQDLFLRLWERARIPIASLTAAYLYTAVRNRALSYLRHQRAWAPRTPFASRMPCPSRVEADHDLQEHELHEALQRAVADLPERCRLVFTLRRYRHLSNAVTARTLGISVNTVEQQMRRALKSLRNRLTPYLHLIAGAVASDDLLTRLSS